jgi:hypothetical protein
VQALRATVDGVQIDVIESSLRRVLHLDDEGGLITLPNPEILHHISEMGYDTSDRKLTFKKGCFSPQWRFFIHTLLHCLSPKKTSYEQFSSTLAYPLVCLATDRLFNFSKFLFENMVGNVDSPYKFLMYPRFIQAVLNEFPLQPHKRIYKTPCLKQKVFQNMTKATESYNGVVTALFPQMLAKIGLTQGEGAANTAEPQNTPPIIIPSITHIPPVTHTYERRSKQPTPPIATLHVSAPFGEGTSGGGLGDIPSFTRDDTEPMPHDSPLLAGNTARSDEGSGQLTELMALCTKLSK